MGLLVFFFFFAMATGSLLWRTAAAGNGKVVWDATSLSSGIYFYRIRSGLGAEVASGKVVKINK